MNKNTISTATIILAILIISGCTNFQDCKQLYDSKNYSSAAACFSKLSQTNQNDANVMLWYAASLYYDNQYEEAYAQYINASRNTNNEQLKKHALNEANKVKIKIQENNIRLTAGNYISDLDYISKWQHMPIRIWIADSQHNYSNAAKRAALTWQKSTNNRVSFVIANTPETADIRIYFVNKITNPESDDQIGRTDLIFSDNKNNSANIELLQISENNTFYTEKQIYYSALHEIGHALGISGHSMQKDDLMYYRTKATNSELTDRDINTINAIYSK